MWKSLHGWALLPAALVAGAFTVLLKHLSIAIPVIGAGNPFASLPMAAVIPLLLVVGVGAA